LVLEREFANKFLAGVSAENGKKFSPLCSRDRFKYSSGWHCRPGRLEMEEEKCYILVCVNNDVLSREAGKGGFPWK
jgi:hypothetical protein